MSWSRSKAFARTRSHRLKICVPRGLGGLPSTSAWGYLDIIGNDVWIGYEAVILSGVTIGDGAIIGARAVVTRDVPPYTIAGGVPAKPIRKRFSDDTISALLNIKWWDWPKERIARHISDIQAGQIGPLQPLGEM